MGSGGGLLGDLMAGGLGYMMGRQQGAPQNQQYPPQYQQGTAQNQQYLPPYQQGAVQNQQYPTQYQQSVPQYQPPPAQGGTQNSQLAQLRLLGRLHDSGVLTNDEFQAEKQKILNGF
jgi:hypothetical protein